MPGIGVGFIFFIRHLKFKKSSYICYHPVFTISREIIFQGRLNMKKLVVSVVSVVYLFVMAGLASAELRPISKIMVKRLVLMQTVISDLAISDFDKAAADAKVLADTVGKDTEILPTAGLKDANTTLGKSLQTFIHAVAKKDPLSIVSSYADIIGNCYGCHAKFRDPKKAVLD